METRTTREYKGQTILPCSYVEHLRQGYHWYLATYHATGIQNDEQISPRYHTLAEAHQDIDYRLEAK